MNLGISKTEVAKLCLILILVMFPAALASSQRRTGTPTKNASGSIRQIDFRNFTYQVDELKITVHQGKWESGTPYHEIGEVWAFVIQQVFYSDLNDYNKEKALIVATGAVFSGTSGWNSNFEKYYLYGIDNGEPDVLQVFDSDDLYKVYSPYAKKNMCEEALIPASPFKSATQINGMVGLNLKLSIQLRGPHCVGPKVSMNVRIDGGHLILIGRPVKLTGKS